MNAYVTGMFMFKIYNQDVPRVFDGFFTYNYEVDDHDTRISNHFHVPQIKSNMSAFGIKYHGVIVWNKILNAKLNPGSSELSFNWCWKNVYCKNLWFKNDHFCIYKFMKIYFYLQYAFICMGNSINNSVLCAHSAPLHPV